MKVNYAKWARGYKKKVRDLSEDESRKLHNNRKLYFVILGDILFPNAFLEINNDFVYVGFLDGLKREYMKYEFIEIEPNNLFLREIQIWDYETNSDTKIFSTRYRFDPEGKFGIEKVDLQTRKTETEEPKSTIDVSNLYVSYPKFGEYENLIKQDRFDLETLGILSP